MSLILSGTSGLSDVDGSAATPAIRGANASTGIFFPASDTIGFAEGGVEAMRLNSSGNLGIGTSSPTAALDIDKAEGLMMRVKRTGVNGEFQLYQASNVIYLDSSAASGNLAFATVGTERMRLDASGNLGIGTSSPSQKLEVSNGAAQFNGGNIDSILGDAILFGNTTYPTAQKNRIRSSISGTGSANLLVFETGNGTIGSYNTNQFVLNGSGNAGLGVTPSAWGSSFRAIDISTGGSVRGSATGAGLYGNLFVNSSGDLIYKQTGYYGLIFQAQADNGAFAWYNAPSGTAGNTASLTQAMTLDASGNLALGTTSASFENGGGQVIYNATVPRLVFRNSTTGTTAFDGTDIAAVGSDFYIFNREAGAVIFGTSGSERARIDSNGNLNIGATSQTYPTSGYKLGVQSGGAQTFISIAKSGQTLNSGGMILGIDGTGGALYVLENQPMDFYTNALQRARITAGGDLCVGTTSAGGQDGVTIYGQYAAQGLITIGTTNAGGADLMYFQSVGVTRGSISTDGTSTTYATSSDYRLKKDIAPMSGALAKVAQLKPVTYKWNADGSDGEGFVAHELAEVAPHAVIGVKDAVDAEGNPKYQGIDTSFLVATLTAAIQEQQALITQLQADVAALKGAA